MAVPVVTKRTGQDPVSLAAQCIAVLAGAPYPVLIGDDDGIIGEAIICAVGDEMVIHALPDTNHARFKAAAVKAFEEHNAHDTGRGASGTQMRRIVINCGTDSTLKSSLVTAGFTASTDAGETGYVEYKEAA